ncbi:MAG: hypothetical protein U0992_11920 [Planctomycetaceae bacterium]
MIVVRRWAEPVLIVALAALCGGLPGCTEAVSSSATVAPCTVHNPSGAERIILTSEAAGDSARCECLFVLTVPEAQPVELELTAVGCSCYQVVHKQRSLKVGDWLTIPGGASAEFRITAQTATIPGTREYRAEFTGRTQNGAVFQVPLASTIRTLPDLVIQPDVVHVEVYGEEAGAKPIEFKIEQTARTDDPESLIVDWGDLPDHVGGTPPEAVGQPLEIVPGVWRATWKCTAQIATEVGEPAEPLRLPLRSCKADRLLARLDCTVLVRRRLGIRAPRLVHFGRVPRSTRPKRRIQLQAVDGRAFIVESVKPRRRSRSRHRWCDCRTEQWLDVQIARPVTRSTTC